MKDSKKQVVTNVVPQYIPVFQGQSKARFSVYPDHRF